MLDTVKQKIQSYFKKASPYCAVGIALHPDRLDIVALKKQDEQIKVDISTRVVCELSEWQSVFAELVNEYKLENAECQVVLAGSQYKVMQVDKPRVPDEELAGALKWSVKDIIPNAEELAMDYFDIPVQNMGMSKINLVTSKLQYVKDTVTSVKKLQLKGITIEELAICSLVPKSVNASLLVTQQPGEDLRVMVVKDGTMFFTRTVAGFAQMVQAQNELALANIADSLSLELQRSMDYFEASLRQAPVTEILVGLPLEYNETVLQGLQQNFDVKVKAFEIRQEDLDKGAQPDYLYYPALGAALEVAHGVVQ